MILPNSRFQFSQVDRLFGLVPKSPAVTGLRRSRERSSDERVANEEVRIKNIELALETAAGLYLENGVENVTREMLAKASGLSRKSLERYFPDKTTCVVKTAQWIGKHLWEKIQVEPDPSGYGHYTAAQLLEMFFHAVEEIFMGEPRFFILYMEIKNYIYRNSPDPVGDYASALMALGWMDSLRRIFKLGETDGTVVSDSGYQSAAQYTYDMMMAFFSSMALLHKDQPEQMQVYIQRYLGNMIGHYCVRDGESA
jgi:AcrR family transcriptional regulator